MAEEKKEVKVGFGPQVKGGKPKNFSQTLKRLFSYFTKHKFRLSIVLLFAIASTGLGTLGPKILGNATNTLLDGVASKMITQQITSKDAILEQISATAPKGVDPEAIYEKEFGGKTDEQIQEIVVNQIKGNKSDEEVKQEIIKKLSGSGNDQIESMKDMLSNLNIRLGQGIDFAALTQVLLMVLAVYFASFILQWIMSWLLIRLSGIAIYSIRDEVDKKLFSVPLKYFDGNSRGDIMSRATNDLDNIAQTLQQSTQQVIQSILQIIFILIMMLTISPLLTLIALVVIPLSFVVAMLIMKKTKPEFAKQWKSTGDLDGHVEEALSGHNIIRFYGQEQVQIDDFNIHNEELSSSSRKSQFLSGLIQPISGFMSNLSYVLIAVVGGLRVASGQITLGDVQAFIQYSRQFNQPVSQIASMVNLFQSAAASAERVFEILDQADEVQDGENAVVLDNVKGVVDFENMYFSYSEDTKLIQDFNLSVEPGKMIAIVGPTGAGKTTLVNLIMRFYDPNSGKIEIDGNDTQQITRHSLRKHISMVLQDVWLFSGSIEDNLRYGIPEGVTMNQEEFLEVTKATYVDPIVRRLPEGYATKITNENDSLSEGEKQLLTIARASLSNPDILILDEATSSVDTRTEVLVQNAMNKLMQGRTSFVIAHRLSTIRGADTILMLENGSIVEQGNHDDLIALNGKYAALYNAQFSGVKA